MSSYDAVYRTLAYLSFLPDCGSENNGSEAELQGKMTSAMKISLANPKLPIRDWRIVWGPRVYKADPANTTSGPDNAWIVVQRQLDLGDGHGVRSVYVLSVAGTTTSSQLDLLEEDLDVKNVVFVAKFASTWWSADTQIPLPVKTETKDIISWFPYIAYGTARGVWSVVSQPSPPGYPGAGIQVHRFLRKAAAADPSAAFVFAGQSLGGAIAPVLAYGSKIPFPRVGTYTLASPATYNNPFTRLLETLLPPQKMTGASYSALNYSIYNTFDIVPKAFSLDPTQSRNLPSISSTYNLSQLGLKIVVEVIGAVTALEVVSKESGVSYTPTKGIAFAADTPPEPRTLDELIDIIKDQHVAQYIKWFNIPNPFATSPDAIADQLVSPIVRYVVNINHLAGSDKAPVGLRDWLASHGDVSEEEPEDGE